MSFTVRPLRPTEGGPFDEVKRLGRAASRTVGFLPAGAFEDYLWRRGILVALDGQNVVGYVLHATSRERVRIAHLVVDSRRRGEGIARSLLDSLRQDRRACYAMTLNCREDFPVTAMWPRMGFEPIARKHGRAGIIVRWWMRLDSPGVFTGDDLRAGPESIAADLANLQ